MGNLNSVRCPVCGTEDRVGNWTCDVCTDLVALHKDLLRNLLHWEVLHRDGQVDDVLTSPDGSEHSLWDIQRFAEARHRRVRTKNGVRRALAARQAEAIEHCLLDNLTEREAALRMGISARSPVAIYVTVGVSRLLGMAYRGEIKGYRIGDIHHNRRAS